MPKLNVLDLAASASADEVDGADGPVDDDPKLNAGLVASAAAAGFGASAGFSPPNENGLAADEDAAGSAAFGAPNCGSQWGPMQISKDSRRTAELS